jgi:hypothetical protein
MGNLREVSKHLWSVDDVPYALQNAVNILEEALRIDQLLVSKVLQGSARLHSSHSEKMFLAHTPIVPSKPGGYTLLTARDLIEGVVSGPQHRLVFETSKQGIELIKRVYVGRVF